MATAPRPRIGVLWGDFPWSSPAPKLGKLFSMGAVARMVTRALGEHGTVVPYRAPPPGAPPGARRDALAAFLRDIDLLWADLYPPSGPALHLRAELGLHCPALLFAGGTLPKGAEAMLFPWQQSIRPGDALIFTCEADRAIWRRLVDRSGLGEWVVPLAVDGEVFHPGAAGARGDLRARQGLPSDGPLLLGVGRLNIQKNLHAAVRLLAAVRRDLPTARLCLIGEEDDIVLGEFGVSNAGYIGRLRALAAELGVGEALTFCGTRFGPDLAALYRAADLLISLSVYHRENFGLAAAEAAACGLPAICSAWGGFKDVVRHGETGYLVEAPLTAHGIRVDWATGADYALALLRDERRRARFGAAAAAHARARFSLAALARTLGEIMATMTGQGDTKPGPAYEPSAFARRYEAHKRACGWYAPAPPPGEPPARYPRMFTGDDYALYETLLSPYASGLAAALEPGAIEDTWVPYFPAGIARDPAGHGARFPDPIWPQECRPGDAGWKIIAKIDGRVTIGGLVRAFPDARPLLRDLYAAGVILFRGRAIVAGDRPGGGA